MLEFTGWIGVEIEASSDKEALEKLLEFCHSGPVLQMMREFGISNPQFEEDSMFEDPRPCE